ncbi:hypothetical protein LTR66_006233 [Elasticomyces elasticus]|nr:hypothetical protein LTR28_010433 [Elasticomyces elasticus]KAK4992582.1 hypothetical protein LTR66_006233 [Elasticomyces elasticus]
MLGTDQTPFENGANNGSTQTSAHTLPELIALGTAQHQHGPTQFHSQLLHAIGFTNLAHQPRDRPIPLPLTPVTNIMANTRPVATSPAPHSHDSELTISDRDTDSASNKSGSLASNTAHATGQHAGLKRSRDDTDSTMPAKRTRRELEVGHASSPAAPQKMRQPRYSKVQYRAVEIRDYPQRPFRVPSLIELTFESDGPLFLPANRPSLYVPQVSPLQAAANHIPGLISSFPTPAFASAGLLQVDEDGEAKEWKSGQVQQYAPASRSGSGLHATHREVRHEQRQSEEDYASLKLRGGDEDFAMGTSHGGSQPSSVPSTSYGSSTVDLNSVFRANKEMVAGSPPWSPAETMNHGMTQASKTQARGRLRWDESDYKAVLRAFPHAYGWIPICTNCRWAPTAEGCDRNARCNPCIVEEVECHRHWCPSFKTQTICPALLEEKHGKCEYLHLWQLGVKAYGLRESDEEFDAEPTSRDRKKIAREDVSARVVDSSKKARGSTRTERHAKLVRIKKGKADIDQTITSRDGDTRVTYK